MSLENVNELQGNDIEYERRIREIIKQIKFLFPPGSTFQISALNPQNRKTPVWNNDYVVGKEGTASGYFQDQNLAFKMGLALEDHANANGVYITLNPCMDDLLARANHRIQANAKGVKDTEIPHICNLLIDIDPKRPEGISSTNEEHQAAIDTALRMKEEAIANGWPEPLVASSGNGAHLIFKVDLPNTPENKQLIKQVLLALHENYSSDKVEIDTKVSNPGTLTKLYGTTARKGDNIPSRPHRLSRIISIPAEPKPVSSELLQAVASTAQRADKATPVATSDSSRQFEFDVESYLSHYGIPVVKTEEHGSATLFCLDKCIFDPSHGPNKSAIGQNAEGKLFYQCFHNSCTGHTWEQARKLISGNDPLYPFLTSATTPLEDIKLIGSILSGEDLINIDFEENPVLIERILGEKEVALFSGPTGIGKSVLTLNIAMHLGSSIVNDIWNFNVNCQVPTLFIQSENTAKATKNRIHLISQGNIALANGARNVCFPSMNLNDIRVTGQSLTDQAFVDFIIEKITETGARLTIFDPLISFHHGDENDNSSMRRALDSITSICDKTNTSAIVIHHLGKDYFRSSTFSGRGASAIGDWADNGFLMEPGKRDKAGLIKMTCQKARNFEKPEPFFLKLNSNLIFERVNPDVVKTITNHSIVVDALTSLGGTVSKQGQLIEKVASTTGRSTGTIRNLIAEAAKTGFIHPITNPSNKRDKGYKLAPQSALQQ
jgi:hypothetical protein